MRVGPRTRALALLGLVVGAIAVAPAAASPGVEAPIGITDSSLAQKGEQLVWSLKLDAPFTAGGLRRARRTVCLVLSRTHGKAIGSICVRSSRRGRMKLRFGPAGKGRPFVLSATLSRSSSRALTAQFDAATVDPGYKSLRWQVTSSVASTTCGTACTAELPSSPARVSLHTPRLVGCVPSGSSLVYGGPANVRDIALSFDDGPWPDPPSIDFARLLARYHVPATFFEIGDQISEYDSSGSVEREMLADGDMLGDHTWTHPDMASLPPSRQRAELEQTIAAIKHATGFTPCLWRPPYGSVSPELVSLARSLGLLTIMWNIDPRDWSLPGTGAIETNVIDNARGGGITEMHFGGGPRYETLDALPTIIKTLRARGYRFVNIAQMLGLKLIYK